jgi:hypothetical protein
VEVARPAGALRFFACVERPPVGICVAWTGVISYAAWKPWLAADSGGLVALVLFVQMFSASAGYRDRMRRGHFDPILTGPRGRLRVAAAHWITAAAPGVAVWLLICTLLWTEGHSLPPPGGWVALLCVSAVPWAISVATTRYTGGTLWTAALGILAGGGWVGHLHLLLERPPSGWIGAARAAGAGLVCPFLLTSSTTGPDSRILLLTAILAGSIWAAGALSIVAFDGPLEEPGR